MASSSNPLFTPEMLPDRNFPRTLGFYTRAARTEIDKRLPRSHRLIAGATALGGLSGAIGAGIITRDMSTVTGFGGILASTGLGSALGAGIGVGLKHLRTKKTETIEIPEEQQIVMIQQPGQDLSQVVIQPVLGSLKKGGYIKKTGLYRLHKGETVVPAR